MKESRIVFATAFLLLCGCMHSVDYTVNLTVSNRCDVDFTAVLKPYEDSRITAATLVLDVPVNQAVTTNYLMTKTYAGLVDGPYLTLFFDFIVRSGSNLLLTFEGQFEETKEESSYNRTVYKDIRRIYTINGTSGAYSYDVQFNP